MLANVLDSDCRNQWEPSLHQAVKSGDKKNILNLLQQGLEVNQRDCCDQTPLHWAAHYGFHNIIDLLIQRGAFVNAKDKNGRTALYFSVKNNHPKSVHALLLANAASNDVNEDKESILYIASLYSCREIIEQLLQAHADVHFISQRHEIMYHAVARNKNKGCLSLFLDKGMNINERRNNGWTPLHDAVWSDNQENVQTLLDAGAYVNLKEEPRWQGNQETAGWRPLHLAAWRNNIEIAQLLVNAGADINAVNNYGKTAFHIADILGFHKFAKTLHHLNLKHERLIMP